MSKKRKPAAPFILISTEDQLAAAANRYVQVSLSYTAEKALHEEEVARLNAAFDERTSHLVEEMTGLVNSCQLYCESHRELFPDERRSREYRNARIGFRWNPVKVEKLLPKDTWDAIGDRMSELPWAVPFISFQSPAVDKDALRNNQANLTADQLQAAGIRFEKGETFFIDPAFDSVERVVKAAA